jgi:Terminase large subunit, endonuclease domain/Terminase large subunit, ATPase domain
MRLLEPRLQIGPDGRALYPELIYGAVKKSGKTTFAGMILIYVIRVLGGKFAEGYVISNSREQAANRVFLAAARIVEASPRLRREAKVSQAKITFTSTGATITAIASDYSTAAGSNPVLSCFDELWAFTTELDHRLFDEMVVPPTKPCGWRLTVTYAGFENESELLEGLYKRGLRGEEVAPGLYAQPGLLMAWHHDFISPWQTEDWREQMRKQLRPSAYLRLIENRWVSSESAFVPIEWWDACTDPELRPMLYAPRLPVWAAVDASVSRDHTALMAVCWEGAAQRVRLVMHREWRPTEAEPLDFAELEQAILEVAQRFAVRAIYYDPYQMQAMAQGLIAARVPMVECAQTAQGLTEISTGLYELFKGRNLRVYPDADLRLAVQRTVAKENPRGWQITKAKASHRIDAVTALAMACWGTVQESTGPSGDAVSAPDLLVDGRPAPDPGWCMDVRATLVATPDGRAGFCCIARQLPTEGAYAYLIDVRELSAQWVRHLCGQCHGQDALLYVDPALRAEFRKLGYGLQALKPEWLHGEASLTEQQVLVMGHVRAGHIKVTGAAYNQWHHYPGGLLGPAAGAVGLADGGSADVWVSGGADQRGDSGARGGGGRACGAAGVEADKPRQADVLWQSRVEAAAIRDAAEEPRTVWCADVRSVQDDDGAVSLRPHNTVVG